MQETKYALHILELDNSDSGIFQTGQSFGLFDSFDEAEEYKMYNYTVDTDYYIYPITIVEVE
jgi:hypothetical protein